MLEPQPLYCLRKLMYTKYGIKKFAIACEIVARWINLEEAVQEKWTAARVENMCAVTQAGSFFFYTAEAEALRKLFGLKTSDDLYTEHE